jgi:D-amino-acid dehydrogenase
MERKKIAIVGAGIVGISSGIYLAKRGCDVTLIDKDFKGKPASYGNASWLSSPSITPVLMPGMVKKIPKLLFSKDGPLFLRFPGFIKIIPFLLKYLTFANKHKVEHISKNLAYLLKDSVNEHKQIAEGTNATKWIEDSPFLFIYKNKKDFINDEYTWSLRKKHGFKLIEVEYEELKTLVPGLSQEYKFAIKIDNLGYISNSQNYLDDLLEGFKKLGGKLIQDEVYDIYEKEDLVQVVGREKSLLVEDIIISSGVYSDKFAKKFGVTVPVQSERGYHLELFDTDIKLKYPIMNGYLKLAITPRPTGIRFAGLVEFGSLNSNPNPKAFELLMRNAKSMFPGIKFNTKQEWSGHRPSTVDSLPVIGSSTVNKKIHFGYGHHHIGLTGGPKTGKILSKTILRDNERLNIEAFDPSR